MQKHFGLFLLFLLTTSIVVMVETTATSAASSLSVPEFTVEIVPMTWSVENPQAVELKIKNISFTPYNNSKGHIVNLYYTIRTKPHDSNEWTEYNTKEYIRDKWVNTGNGLIIQSDTEYTIKTWGGTALDNSKMDYQVRVFEAYVQEYFPYTAILYSYLDFQIIRGSDWSDTRILTMNKIGSVAAVDKSTPTTPVPTETPTPEEPSVYQPYIAPIAIAAVVIALGGGLFVYDQRKQR